MIDKKKLDEMEARGASAALKYRDELCHALNESIRGTSEAVNAYFTDQQKKAEAIANRAVALGEDVAGIDEEISSLGPTLAQATISGDVDTLAAIQKNLADLEARKAACKTQISLLMNTHVSGDSTLYQIADQISENMEAAYSEKMQDLQSLLSFARKQSSLWASVADLSSAGADMVPIASVRNRVSDMRRDYAKAD